MEKNLTADEIAHELPSSIIRIRYQSLNSYNILLVFYYYYISLSVLSVLKKKIYGRLVLFITFFF